MKRCLLALFLFLGLVACAEAPSWEVEATDQAVVYGDDNRLDVYEHPDPIWAQAALDQTVAIMDEWALILGDPDDIGIWAEFLQQAAGLCMDQIWLDQLSAADCSGTLIDTDLVLTAGHCVSGSTVFTSMRFVFNYAMADADTLNTITSDDVYSCVEILVQEETMEMDYAIVRLDRPVVGRSPAVVDASPLALAEGTGLVVMGCPTGLPIKIADDGYVRDGRPASLDYFVSNLDTFGGNSGSGVYRADSRALVGILVRGDVDYLYDETDMCSRIHECPMDGCRGEDSTYAFVAVEDFCDTVGDSVICACGDGTCDGGAGESTVTCPADCGTDCGDGACNGDESPLNCSDDCGTCGNQVCEAEEAAAGDCCIDCGCEEGLVCLNNACEPDPSIGDSCESPIEIPASGTQVIPGDNLAASNTTEGSCGGQGSERVFFFSLAEEADVVAEVSGYDTVMYLRAVCDDGDSELDCNDDDDLVGDLGSRLEISALAAGDYYLFVDAFDESASGHFDLSLSFVITGSCPDGDADGDGVCDDVDGCPNDPAKAEPGICGCGVLDTDSDSDGTADCVDACPNDAGKIAAGDCGCGVADTDSDADGTADCVDACPNDAAKIAAGDCGCGVADTDSDADGTADCVDACPNDANKIAAGDCGCGVADADSDSDGTADCIDGCPEDGDKTEVGICGCGVADTDSDGDGVADCEDACPEDPSASQAEQCEPDDDSGCGCATGSGQPMEGMTVLLMLAGIVWRRRRD